MLWKLTIKRFDPQIAVLVSVGAVLLLAVVLGLFVVASMPAQ
jgi:hypothetical protein